MRRKQLKRLERELDDATDYAAWCELAQEHDAQSGMAQWRSVEPSDLYDAAQIRFRLDRLRDLRRRKDWQGLLFALNEGIHGNMGGMGKSVLYRQAKLGTKQLIEDYIDAIDDSLRQLADLPESVISGAQKQEFFARASKCFGRSALLLSGGGTLGFLHLGVVNTLLAEGLVPPVVSGSSAGALVAAVLGCHSDSELAFFQDPGRLSLSFENQSGILMRLLAGGNQLVETDLDRIIAQFLPDLTFEEAFAKTGREVSITVAPAEPHQRSRLLNAITSPNVFIRSAVKASCAVPGIFPAVMLTAKNVHGESQPYLPNRRWIDGSVADDLPIKRLSRLYGTNHSIVSMVNPIATAFLRGDERRSSLSRAARKMTLGIGRESLNFYRGIAQRYGDSWPRFNKALHGLHALLDQEYSGDINIVPSIKRVNPFRLLVQPSSDELQQLIRLGEQTTFPKVEAIRRCTQISRTLAELMPAFQGGEKLARVAALQASSQEKGRSARKKATTMSSDVAKGPKKAVKKKVPRPALH